MLNLLLAAAFFFPPAASAHNRHHHRNHGPRVVISTWGFNWHIPRPRKIRLNEHCVYKPWNDKTVCKY